MNLLHYLIEKKGYKPFRWIKDKMIPEQSDRLDYFSSTEPGYDSLYLYKREKCCIWGLHEYGYPPTLIYPTITSCSDRFVSNWLENNSLEDICESLNL